jgi:hypothetical protein
MLDTVTYSEPAVAELIAELFVPVQCNVTQEASKPLIRQFRQAWTPDVRVLNSECFELYRWNGYLPPFEFMPQLLVGGGQACLRMDQLDRAAEMFEETLRRFPTSASAAEAGYYLPVAKYKASHEGNDLIGGWQRLQSQHPNSIWRTKQSFSEAPKPAAKQEERGAVREEVSAQQREKSGQQHG